MRYLLLAFLSLLLYACGKDSLNSKPQLSLKSIWPTNVDTGQDVLVILSLADKEGDFLDTIWLTKKSVNCSKSDRFDSTFYNLPKELPRTRNFKGEIELTLRYVRELRPKCLEIFADTVVFFFRMKDAKGNYSDTVKTPVLIIQNK